MIKKTLFVTQNTPFGQQKIQNTLFYGFYLDGRKIITYALGGQDPESPQSGRTSSKMQSLEVGYDFETEINNESRF